MSDMASWQEGNEKYLSAALAWLRKRLERLVGQEVTLTSTPSTPENGSWLQNLIRRPLNKPRQTNLSSLRPEEKGWLADS